MATQADIENVFGVANVAAWSNLDPDETTADTDRIALALANAEENIADMFRGGNRPELLPLPTNYQTTDWVAKKAGVWLFQSRPTGGQGDASVSYADMIEEVDRVIGLYISGARRFNRSETGPTAPYMYKGGSQ